MSIVAGKKREYIHLGIDERNNTTLRDDDVTEELVQSEADFRMRNETMKWLDSLLIVADSELKVTGNDTLLLVVPGSVASELKNLSSEVFKDSRKIN